MLSSVYTLLSLWLFLLPLEWTNHYNGKEISILAHSCETTNNDLIYPLKGITVVAPPKPVDKSTFHYLKKMNADWVALVPYGFSRKTGLTEIHYDLEWQWWGEKRDGIISCMTLAKSAGLKIMLKPQIYLPGSWVGHLDFSNAEEWKKWENNYRKFILDYACLAEEYGAEMLCIGTELENAAEKNPGFWRQLIDDIRVVYHGKLIYSANWDSYQRIRFWDKIDYIGMSSYFPLSDQQTPEKKLLNEKWKPFIKKLRNFARLHQKKIIFTEYGYMSVDKCAYKTWEIEKQRNTLNVNETAQANAYDALWESFSKEDFWGGGFVWKWFPEGMGHEGYPEKDYTPQHKKAEKVLQKWFTGFNKI